MESEMSSMTNSSSMDDLIQRWREIRKQGRFVSAEELLDTLKLQMRYWKRRLKH